MAQADSVYIIRHFLKFLFFSFSTIILLFTIYNSTIEYVKPSLLVCFLFVYYFVIYIILNALFSSIVNKVCNMFCKLFFKRDNYEFLEN